MRLSNNYIYRIGLLLFAYILFIFLSTNLLNWIGITEDPNASQLINLSFILAIRFIVLRNRPRNERIIAIGGFVFFVALSIIISFFFDDISYDGQFYHLEAIKQLSEGWNPYFNNPTKDNTCFIFIKCFSKAGWYVNNHFFLSTGFINCSKATNFILFFSSIGIILNMVSKFITTNLFCWITTSFVAFNPIMMNMCLSNMVDLQLTFGMYFIIVFLIDYLLTEQKYLLGLISISILYIINIKFTAIIYCLILGVGLFSYLLFYKKVIYHKKLLIICSISFVVGIMIFGYPTYIRNIKEEGHVFHPLYGTRKLPGVFALDYSKGNQFINFSKSIFARTTFSKAFENHVSYKIPFTFNQYELERYAFAGVLIGGFGVWWSGIVIFAIMGLIVLFIYHLNGIKKKEITNMLFLLTTILISSLSNPHAYIARYVPQLYLLPILFLIIRFIVLKKQNLLDKILIFAMYLNLLFMGGYFINNIIATNQRHEELRKLSTIKSPIYVDFGNQSSNKILFKEYQIKYIQIKKINCSEGCDSLTQSEVKIKY